MRFSVRQSNHYLSSAPLQGLQFKSWLNDHLCLSLTQTKYPVKCSLSILGMIHLKEYYIIIQNLYRQVSSQKKKIFYSARKEIMKHDMYNSLQAVESEWCQSFTEAIKNGKPVKVHSNPDTLADGLNVSMVRVMLSFIVCVLPPRVSTLAIS